MRKIRVLIFSNNSQSASTMQWMIERKGYHALAVIVKDWKDVYVNLGGDHSDVILFDSFFWQINEMVFLEILKKYPTIVTVARYDEQVHDMIRAYDRTLLFKYGSLRKFFNVLKQVTAPLREELARLGEVNSGDSP